MDANTIALYSLFLAIPAFIISVFQILKAVIQFVKSAMDRELLHVKYRLEGRAYDHVIIEFRNISKKTIFVEYWNVVWRKNYIVYVEYGDGLINFPPANSFELQPGEILSFDIGDTLTGSFVGLHDQKRSKLFAEIKIVPNSDPKWFFLSDANYNPPFWKTLFRKPKKFRFPE